MNNTGNHLLFGGSGVAIMSPEMVTACGGLIIGFIGLCINTVFKWKMYKLEQKRNSDGNQ